MKGNLAILTVAAVFALPVAANATDFFSDDFESYADDAAVTAAGWIIFDTPTATEAGTTWTITNPAARGNPHTLNGSGSAGNFMISDSDFGGGAAPTPTDSGGSYDLTTPSFSTVGASGDVWLHADTTAILNNNGAAILFVDVSTDGGSTWATQLTRVATGRVSSNAATTFLPDNSNSDGYFGQLDVNLGAIGGEADVRARIRHYEPNYDWWISVDNVIVNDTAPVSGGATIAYAEDFNSYTLGTMGVYGVSADAGGRTWDTLDLAPRYAPGAVGERGVNRLGHPMARDGDLVPFAIIDSDNIGSGVDQDEYLHTPILDLSRLNDVVLEYDSEIVPLGDAHRVLLMEDDGDGVPNAADAVLSVVFDYLGTDYEKGEEPAYAERAFLVPEADGRDDVYFAFHYAGSFEWWWAVDNVQVSGTIPEPSTFAVALLLGLATVGCGLRKRRL